MKPSITFRPRDSRDEEFLFRLFRSAHEYKFEPLCLPDEQLTQLLRMQFGAQERQYQWQFRDGDFQIVLSEGVPIGRLYVWRGAEEIVLVDVTILPEHRYGIGAALVRQLLREGEQCGKPVHAHVEKINRARKLWLRLGFRIVEDTGVYYRLEKLPASAGQCDCPPRPSMHNVAAISEAS